MKEFMTSTDLQIELITSNLKTNKPGKKRIYMFLRNTDKYKGNIRYGRC